MSNTKHLSKFRFVLGILCSAILLVAISCGEGSPADAEGNSERGSVEPKEKKEKKSNLFEVSGKVFSVPSPIQTAFLLKEAGTNYQSSLLNSVDNKSEYLTSSAKALNLGVYGADLGYATIFDASEDAINYIAVTKSISAELGISNLFDESMLKRFEANIGNQDSLLVMVSDAFKTTDQYLKNNNQNDLSVLILAGGWIETLHFATSLAADANSDAVKNRIAEQKITIKNLINLLLPFSEDEHVSDLMNQLNELKDLYSDITFTYTYVEPETNAESKTTVIKSESKVEISDEQLNQISQKVASIRNSII